MDDAGLALGQRLLLSGEEEQQALGQRLATLLPRGTLLFLEGDLGAGKTTLVQGLLRGLEFDGQVSSPTYALMHDYPTPYGRVLHVDAYRVRHAQELFEMELERLTEEAYLSVIEWGELLYNEFPAAPILHLAHLDGQPGTRQIERRR
ncbi:tRNA (adenosine(37)-N6)-threonylcarbamoyltransferase complex ATPase subunit type 1 TsaE [Deinococcus sp. KNUC1210]|nr:tRNA (adenosine(37)-N6)-threonylcarbamoyltransferase complex ATPase subunit type 1 TsaE [Deinococcus sp. KNUC1210]ULH16892.1 tRNA (adenosine(37)-N6)-threonylcarbamoyltransferase complex ATPase subunit type 1 TsaE [Deinococcus sp. KNUC1210]